MVALTAVALPILFKENRSNQDGRPSPVAAVAPGGNDLASGLRAGDTTVAETSPDATVINPAPAAGVATTEIVIAVPTSPPDGQLLVNGKAGYQTWRSSLWDRPCAFPKAPVTSAIHVMNLDNGKTTSCTVVSNQTPPDGMVLVLDTSVFTEIADLLEAPVPVRVTWGG